MMAALPQCPACTGALVATCVHGDEIDRAFRALADLPAAKERAAQRKLSGLPDSSQEGESGEAYDVAGAAQKISGRTVRRLDKIQEIAPEMLDEIRAKNLSIARAYLEARNTRGDHGSAADSDTYFTPRRVIDAVVAHIGPIDLDPCTTVRNWVGAKHYYSLQRNEDGLALPWHVAPDGTPNLVWINPPYTNSAPLAWIQRAHRESAQHGITVVMLVPAAMGSEYAQYALQHATTIHYLRDRLNFLGVDEKPTGSAPFDAMLVGFNVDLNGIDLPGVTR